MNALSPKLEPRHLQRRAIVYVRQSTARQVLTNQESTRRQYQLAERARQMGWGAPQVEVIDEDLGLSGASSHARTGFQRLVAAIGLGEVGIVLVTEVSRLSRRNSDWHRVIELCAVFRTLIADEDGIYCPQDPNDRLLLGVKGTLFAAELHILHARMRGNLLNKARRGELALRLPVGYRRLGDGTVVQDPDEAVRAALARIFERFAVLRNAPRGAAPLRRAPPPDAAAHPAGGGGRPHRLGAADLPDDPAGADQPGLCRGVRLRPPPAGDQPRRSARRRRAAPAGGGVGHRRAGRLPGLSQLRPIPAEPPAPAGQPVQLRGQAAWCAPRGPGLLQGLVVCGRCGRRMSVSHGSRYLRYECRRAQIDYGTAQCQAFPAIHLDRAAGALFLEAVRPAALETTLAALAALEQERQALDRHWQLRLERARYDVQRAQRQYDAIEPENRLVARTLETRWNQALQALEQLEQDYAVVRRTELLPLDAAEQGAVRQLAADLPTLWPAATTADVDRKRLLRLVVTEVVLTVDAPARRAEVTIVWSGGATSRHEVRCPPLGQHARTDAAAIQRLGELAQHHPDHHIAARLNAEGLLTRTGKAWTYERVRSMRKQHGITAACPLHTREAAGRADGMMPVKVAARRLGVSPSLLHVWVRHGVLAHDQRLSASRVWVRLDGDDQVRLDGSSPVAPSLPRFVEVRQAEQLSAEALWDQVRHGKYQAFRARHGQSWEWRLRRSPASRVGCENEEPHHHA